MVNEQSAQHEPLVEAIELRASGRDRDFSPELLSQFPQELIDDASRRLRFVAVVMLVGGIVSVVVGNVLAGRPPVTGAGAIGLGLFAFANLLVYFVAGANRLPAGRLFDLGSAYQVVVAGFIAVRANALPWPDTPFGVTVPLLALWIVLFPVIVPNTVRRTLAAGIVSWAMDPITLLVMVRAPGVDMPGPAAWLTRSLQLGAAVALAVLISRVVRRMGAKAASAREIGSYRLDQIIGQGGMGEVWRATHRILKRPTAVKLIHADILHDESPETRAEMIERFNREARATAALRSPHTIELYDFGVGNGRLYYVMEWLDGFDLHALVEMHGPQLPGRTIHFLRQTCHSLHEAHLGGLAHRDIKPQNIFVCRYGADLDFVKVLDFGLVKALAGPSQPTMQLTRTGTVTGTPLFLAPEQVTERSKVDHRADIYSLGCVAYYLLSGEYLFRAVSSMAVAVAHAKETPTPLSEVAEQELPRGLEDVIMRCLCKDPADRPQSVAELLEALGPVDVGDEWNEERCRAWWEANHPLAVHSGAFSQMKR